MTQQNDSRTTKIEGVFEDLELAQPQVADQGSQPLDDDQIIPWVIELRIIGTPHIVHVPVKETLVIGRKDEARGILPDIDLGPFEAQQRGVSRKHARMIMRDNRLTIEDLGSANGTYVNGQMLDILRPQRVHGGDHIKLGTLSFQVHFLVKPSINDDTMHGIGNQLKLEKIAEGQHLLVLDDNQEVCQVIRYVAVQSGFQVSVAHNLNDAYALVDSQTIDLIILELMLPDGSGLDLVEYVRQKYGHPVPIIATASTTGGFTSGQAFSTGVEFLLTKPLAIDTLAPALAKVVAALPIVSTDSDGDTARQ